MSAPADAHVLDNGVCVTCENDEDGEWEEGIEVLKTAIAELLDEGGDDHVEAAFDPSKHPRNPKGSPGAGRFRSLVDRLKDAIQAHRDGKGGDHPFDGFEREQLRRVAKARGIELKRGESRDSIAQKLLDHLGSGGESKIEKPPAPKKKSSSAKTVAAGDFSGLKRVGDQAGSNPGGFFEADDGSRWYVKAQRSADHAANEVTASALYREAGVDVPDVVRGTGAPGLGDGPQTASRVADGVKSDLQDRLDDHVYLRRLGEGFAVDAWLANWDVAGLTFDNVASDGDTPIRIDLGGALLFRAQGKPKGSAFGDEALEWDTLRDPATAPQASQLFGSMVQADLADAAAKVEAVSPDRIRALVAEHGLAPEVADRLIARRADILKRAKPSASFEDRIAKAATGEAALDAPPLAKKDYLGTGLEAVPNKDRQAVLNALHVYQGSGYVEINETLRGSNPGPDVGLEKHIKHIDQAMDLSPLSRDVIVYRGIRNGKVFGGDEVLASGRDLSGLEFGDLSYSSTSADKRVADDFAAIGGESPVVMRILVPAGVKGVRLSDLGPPGMKSFSPGVEAEILLQRGLRFRVVGDSKGLVNGARRIDVEVIT